MDRLKELRAAYSAKCEENQKYLNENIQIAHAIADGFREYIGLPQSFVKIGTSDLGYYIQWRRVEEDGETLEVDYYSNAVRAFGDGTFDFAFGVVIDRDENTFPKSETIIKVECTRRPNNVTVSISDKSVGMPFHSRQDFDATPVHELLYDLILDHFGKRIGQGTKSMVGFDII